MKIIDNFVSEPHKLRTKGVNTKFKDWTGYDGEVYKRVSAEAIPEVVDALNKAMGRPIELLGMGWRLNYAGELPNHAVHTDAGWGRWASVLYMDTTPPAGNGTAFWRHKATGLERASFDTLTPELEADWNNQDAWEQVAFCDARFNRAIIYESDEFHSRWPLEAYGTTPEDGRLIIVAFWN